ncbi:3-deoxy-8-phosphooctulonate synthase, partial [Francisella tularensis subsp. holarctica]|nr:3-deoxy-8-phosphooctulonate synthase [Francisella tularensis subsp. holarctica]
VVYLSYFDKANSSYINRFIGLCVDKGLENLAKVKKTNNVPVVTDVHEDTPYAEVAEVVDVLQIPAFLFRQTNFILEFCKQGQ